MKQIRVFTDETMYWTLANEGKIKEIRRGGADISALKTRNIGQSHLTCDKGKIELHYHPGIEYLITLVDTGVLPKWEIPIYGDDRYEKMVFQKRPPQDEEELEELLIYMEEEYEDYPSM